MQASTKMKINSWMLWAAVSAVSCAASAQTAQKAEKVESSKIMTRDELRACTKAKTAIADLAASMATRKTELDAEKAQLAPARAELSRLQPQLDEAAAAFKAVDADVREHNKLIDAWNVDMEEAAASQMKSAERRRVQLKKDRVALDQKATALADARDKLGKKYNDEVARFNAVAQSIEARAKAWNQKNEELAKDGDRHFDMRSEYGLECASRRFREEDEAAIKAGK